MLTRLPLRAVLLVACSAAAASVSASDFLSTFYYFPIVSNTQGKGGTRWQSEVSLSNPHPFPINVTARLSTSGTYLEQLVALPARGALHWDNYLGDHWGVSGNAAVYFKAEPSLNGGRSSDCLDFAAANKVVNVGSPLGTYGQEVAPANVLSGFMGSWPAYFAGIRNYGTPGVDGFRTTVGFWSLDLSSEVVKVTIYDASGAQRWQQMVTVERHTPFILSIPSDLDIRAGLLVIDPMGRFADIAPFVSVVDNRTGDGVSRSPLLQNPDDSAACGGLLQSSALGSADVDVGREDRNTAARRLEGLFLGRGAQ